MPRFSSNIEPMGRPDKSTSDDLRDPSIPPLGIKRNLKRKMWFEPPVWVNPTIENRGESQRASYQEIPAGALGISN